nr:unnamed protein product [Callosobruchus chinensis]
MIQCKFRDYKLVVCGDFNVNFLEESANLGSLLDLLGTWDIQPTIKLPTRIHSCLDNIFVNLDKDLYQSSVINGNISDHFGQLLSIRYGQNNFVKKTPNMYRQLHNKENIDYFNELLLMEKWDSIYSMGCDVNYKFDMFSKYIFLLL